MRRARLGVLLLLASIGTVVFWTVSSRTPHLEPARASPSDAARDDALPAPAVATPPAPERTPQESPTAVAPKSEETDDPWLRWLRDPETGILVEGTMSVIDAAEREHAEEDGEFVPLALRENGGGGNRKVPVHAGRFRMHMPVGCDLGIASLVLGGRRAFLEPDPARAVSMGDEGTDRRFTITEGQPVHVVARWARPFVLHVVDAVRKAELDDVTVVLMRSTWWSKAFAHPGAIDAGKTLVESAPSPIELSGPDAASNLQWVDLVWVHAPGRTWGSARVDFKKGGETTIELGVGADLEVTLVGTIPPAPPTQKLSYEEDTSRAVLRMRPRDLADLVLEAPPVSGGTTRFEGLRAGAFDLSLERGKFFDRPQVLGATKVELVAGSLAHATITITPPQEPRRVRVTGTLHLSPEWKCTWLDLRFEPMDVPGGTSLEARGLALGDLVPIAGSPGDYRFELTPILPGRYLVQSYTYAYQQIIETGEAGRDDVVISIGDPADVLVHVLDADSGLPVREPNVLLWNCRWPDESTGGGLESTTWDESRQAWRFRAPAGEIELHVAWDARDWELCEPTPYVAVRPGPNELTIRVRRASGFFLRFEIGGKRIEWPRDLETLRIYPAGAEPFDFAVRRIQDDAIFVATPTSGRWRVVVSPLRGYGAVEPIEVDAQAGTIRRIAVELVGSQ